VATAAPTVSTPPPTAAPLAAVVPSADVKGASFLFTFRELPPGTRYVGQLVRPTGEVTSVPWQASVPSDGVVQRSLKTDPTWDPGNYLLRLTAGSVVRSIVFTLNP
jgi:hypothetical protein